MSMDDDGPTTFAHAESLVRNLRLAADKIERGALNSATGPYAVNLADTLVSLLSGDMICSALVTVQEEDYPSTDCLVLDAYPPAIYELTGRLNAICTRLGLLATTEEETAIPEDLQTRPQNPKNRDTN